MLLIQLLLTPSLFCPEWCLGWFSQGKLFSHHAWGSSRGKNLTTWELMPSTVSGGRFACSLSLCFAKCHNLLCRWKNSYVVQNSWWTEGKMLVESQICTIKDNYCLIKTKPKITKVNLQCITGKTAPNYW